MAVVTWSRYEYAPVHQDADGNLFLDVPDPVDPGPRIDDDRKLVAEGDTLWTLAWRKYRAVLDREQDVRPSGFWWVIAEVNKVVDPFEPLTPGTYVMLPSVEALFGEILTPPDYYERNREE